MAWYPEPTRAASALSPQCCDTGFHLALGQVLRSYAAAERCTQASQMQALGSLEEAVEALDPPGDKAKVLEVHAVAFCPPLRFDYQPHEGDEVRVAACRLRQMALCFLVFTVTVGEPNEFHVAVELKLLHSAHFPDLHSIMASRQMEPRLFRNGF